MVQNRTVIFLILAEAALAMGAYTLAAILHIDVDPWVYLTELGGLWRILVAVGSILFGLYFVDLYSNVGARPKSDVLLQSLSLVMGGAFLLQAVLSYAKGDLILPKWVMMEGSAFTFIALLAWRLIFGRVILPVAVRERILFLGYSSAVHEIAGYFAGHGFANTAICGVVAHEPPEGSLLPFLGTIDQFQTLVESSKPTRIVVDLELGQDLIPVSYLLSLRLGGVAIESSAMLFERFFGRLLLRQESVQGMIFSSRLGPSRLLATFQIVYSYVGSVVGIILTGPLMIATAIGVKLTSPGPVFFKQVRVGRNGKLFKVIKFRSMYINVDPQTGPRGRDPRITPLGWYLRKFRIDELPQFFNILRGEMLLVGPRPEIPEFTRIFTEKIPLYQERLLVKPGITGWAQVNHKLEEQIEDTIRKLGYDLYYIKNLSLGLDLFVIFHTVKIMLLSRGAR